jgi:hypothetical protein
VLGLAAQHRETLAEELLYPAHRAVAAMRSLASCPVVARQGLLAEVVRLTLPGPGRSLKELKTGRENYHPLHAALSSAEVVPPDLPGPCIPRQETQWRGTSRSALVPGSGFGDG